MTTRLANLYAFQTEFDRHGDASSPGLARFVAPFAQRIFYSRSNILAGCAERISTLSTRPSGVTSNLTRTEPSIRSAWARVGYAGWLRLIARGPLGAVRVGFAVAGAEFGCVRAGAVLVVSNGEATRVSAGFTSRFGCSTFFSGFGLGLGFGLGSGL